MTTEAVELLILGMYGVAAGRMVEPAPAPSCVQVTHRVAGGLLAGAGTGLALESSRIGTSSGPEIVCRSSRDWEPTCHMIHAPTAAMK